MFVLRLLLVVLVGSVWTVLAQECANETLPDCFKYVPDIESRSMDVPSWNETEAQLQYLCGNATYFASCMKEVTPRCDKSFALRVQGWNSAYRFFCIEENLKEFIHYQPCFGRDDVREEVRRCAAIQRTPLNILYGLTNLSNVNIPVFCSFQQVYLDCVAATLSSSCGQNSSDWQYVWIRDLTKPFTDYLGCQGLFSGGSDITTPDDSTDESGWTIVLSVVLAVTTFVLFLGVVLFAAYLIGKRKRSNESEPGRPARSHQVESPPPYAMVAFGPPTADGQRPMHLIDRDSSQTASTFDGNAPQTGIILPPPYPNSPGDDDKDDTQESSQEGPTSPGDLVDSTVPEQVVTIVEATREVTNTSVIEKEDIMEIIAKHLISKRQDCGLQRSGNDESRMSSGENADPVETGAAVAIDADLLLVRNRPRRLSGTSLNSICDETWSRDPLRLPNPYNRHSNFSEVINFELMDTDGDRSNSKSNTYYYNAREVANHDEPMNLQANHEPIMDLAGNDDAGEFISANHDAGVDTLANQDEQGYDLPNRDNENLANHEIDMPHSPVGCVSVDHVTDVEEPTNLGHDFRVAEVNSGTEFV